MNLYFYFIFQFLKYTLTLPIYNDSVDSNNFGGLVNSSTNVTHWVKYLVAWRYDYLNKNENEHQTPTQKNYTVIDLLDKSRFIIHDLVNESYIKPNSDINFNNFDLDSSIKLNKTKILRMSHNYI